MNKYKHAIIHYIIELNIMIYANFAKKSANNDFQ